jgi:hypothetical protein
LLTEIEARLDFDDEMPPLDVNLVIGKIHGNLDYRYCKDWRVLRNPFLFSEANNLEVNLYA